ncbi:uncharacterized protein ACLA_065590 [Aspergillus clavatus NRRL 1]|uniref:Uncharacterized protein n=1 Tax=Aspergillus clavatus (strain ATCC 1007 / CBS 513.65 / DSM 816 / NCTC 3887 / NRRL 1 / QM 1276 / 107) TaxID=344612 RepID=A1CG45_ASPCL|nr:uncharacterized protein ACLA_065590 [Aspergillus clavatus NRRL 1]EAW10925.1 hypothetical protein ACLA_065590 [Aspergillus clavatus NRRL 1]
MSFCSSAQPLDSETTAHQKPTSEPNPVLTPYEFNFSCLLLCQYCLEAFSGSRPLVDGPDADPDLMYCLFIQHPTSHNRLKDQQSEGFISFDYREPNISHR